MSLWLKKNIVRNGRHLDAEMAYCFIIYHYTIALLDALLPLVEGLGITAVTIALLGFQ